MIDFRIETFLMVCKYMNFTRAAEALGLTQPAVSQHIKYLEEEYGVKLFAYQKKKISLTEAGKRLLEAALTMRHDESHLKKELRELQGKKKSLVFGVTLTIGEFTMPGLLAEYLKNHPAAEVKMTVANTKELLKELNEGLIDFALVEGFFAKNEYDSLVYSAENYIPVCAADYAPAREMKKIEDTFRERLIVREAGSGTREIFERYLESRNFQLGDYKDLLEIGSIGAIKSLTAAGCGITFLYERAVREELAAGRLKKIPLEDFHVTHDFTFIWPKNSIFSGYYKELFQMMGRGPVNG